MAFGLNRAEIFTRMSKSGDTVQFPRIIGIEAIGTVDKSTSYGLEPGQKVVTTMGGMGRDFNGSYAEYLLVPSSTNRKFFISTI